MQVLPVLEQHMEVAQQRLIVWHTLRAMPLRLLERVMPWLAGAGPLYFLCSYAGLLVYHLAWSDLCMMVLLTTESSAHARPLTS